MDILISIIQWAAAFGAAAYLLTKVLDLMLGADVDGFDEDQE